MTTTPPPESLWDVVLADPERALFAGAVEDAGLVDLFDGSITLVDLSGLLGIDLQIELGLDPAVETITALVPTNAAIEAAPGWPEIQDDPAALRRFVLSHVVPDSYLLADIFAVPELTNLNNEVLTVDPLLQTINGAHVLVPDVAAPNGFLHTVDAVLVAPAPTPPPTIPETPPATLPATPPQTPPATPPGSTPLDTSGG